MTVSILEPLGASLYCIVADKGLWDMYHVSLFSKFTIRNYILSSMNLN